MVQNCPKHCPNFKMSTELPPCSSLAMIWSISRLSEGCSMSDPMTDSSALPYFFSSAISRMSSWCRSFCVLYRVHWSSSVDLGSDVNLILANLSGIQL